jgi:hypothetical protein
VRLQNFEKRLTCGVSAWNNCAHGGGIFMIFDIREFLENMSKNLVPFKCDSGYFMWMDPAENEKCFR